MDITFLPAAVTALPRSARRRKRRLERSTDVTGEMDTSPGLGAPDWLVASGRAGDTRRLDKVATCMELGVPS